MLKFIVEVGLFLGTSGFVFWLLFGTFVENYSQREPFKFWMLVFVTAMFVLAGLAKRALVSFHPTTDEAKSVSV